jgi:hypothetical protein
MDKFTDLRNSITHQQKIILNEIFSYFDMNKTWIPIRVLHAKCGGKEAVRKQLEELGGSIVFEYDDQGTVKYQLTFLGMLLSYYGEIIEFQISTFINITKALIKGDPEKTIIRSTDIAKMFEFNPSDVTLMGKILFLSPFHANGGNGPEGWNCKVPDDIEDIPEDAISYIHEKVMKDYDKNVPIDSTARSSYIWGRIYSPKEEKEEDNFFFIKDEKIKKIVFSDWNEVKSCYQGKAWKYTIIGCGSVLEGILLDCLLQDTAAAIDARKIANPDRNPGNDLLSWDLIDLMDAAKQLKIIGEASSHLGHALRLHRNLVHPGRQIKEIIEISEEEAQISFATVEKCIKDLSSKIRQK